MKKLFSTLSIVSAVFALATIFLTGCGNDNATTTASCDADVKQLKIDSLEKVVQELPQKIAAERQHAEDSVRLSYENLGLMRLNFASLRLADTVPHYNVSSIAEAAAGYYGGAEYGGEILSNFLGMDMSALRTRLENPAVLQKFFNDNKDAAVVVLQKTGRLALAQKYASTLLPYFSHTSPLMSKFDAYFQKHGNKDDTDWDNADWDGITTSVSALSADDIKEEYRAYLFAKRRQLAGGPQLMQAATQILTYIKGL